MVKINKNYLKWYFLIIMILLYILLFIYSKDNFQTAIRFVLLLLKRILFIFIFIFVLLVVTNYFLEPKKIIKYLGYNSGIKGWLFIIIAGILSSGPIYLWYPLLSDLREKGMRTGLITTFLYNRSIKIALFPLLIAYFGLLYSFLLTITIILVSVIQGLLSEKILKEVK